MYSRILSLALLLVLAAPAPSWAYMSLLRQGVESAEVPNSFDHYGDRVAAGDFNGDGYEDIAVAAPDENNDIGVSAKHGVVIVSYGSEAGITHLSADVLSVGAPTDALVRFGKGLAAGDFNGDGVDDLAVGLPGADTIGLDDVGSVWVYAGIQDVGISLAPYVQLDQSDCGATVEKGDQFGYTLCAGDMGGDGFDDLFVGSIGEDSGAGLVGFFPGSVAGVTSSGSGFAKQSHLGGVDGAGDSFGYSLALGDFLGDGNLDLAIGAPYADEGSLLDMGRVYVVRGTANGPVVTGGEILTPLSLNVPLQLGRAFGWSLAAGTFLDQGGARPDLAIGEPLFAVDGQAGAGRVVVVDYDGPGDAIHVGALVLDQGVLGETVQAGSAFGWSLAAGDISTNGGIAGPDDRFDLAIGAPNVDVLVPGSNEGIYWSNAGVVYLAPGSNGGFALGHVKVLDAMERNDLWFDFDEKMGWSLCFGKFDGTGWDNLAIGVPQKDYPAFIDPDTVKEEAGQVYVMAPWRQPAGRPHRSSIVQDCAGRILYAQRMFQRLTPASITKALTALLAVEAMQAGTVDGDQMYTVPAWAANDVTGSQYGLIAGERISFADLVRTMIAVSGNDCAYTIGNILTGEDNDWDYGMSTSWNLEHILSDFAAMMNARATQLGMSSAHTFNNPAGRPVGDHWTTAADQAIFVGEAMKNADFRDIVGTTSWPNVFRQLPINAVFPWLPPMPGTFVPMVDTVGNGYFSSILARDSRAAGVKGGWNAPSAATGLYSAELDNGYAKCTIFGVPPYGALADFGAELMSLVGTDCLPEFVTPIGRFIPPHADAQRTNIPLDEGRPAGVGVEIDPLATDDTSIDVLRRDIVTPSVCVDAKIERTSTFDLATGEQRSFGAQCQNNLKQMGLALHNHHDTQVARLHLEWIAADQSIDVVLQPGESWVAPLQPVSATVDGQDLLIWNNGDGSDYLELEETYGLGLTLGRGTANDPSTWNATLIRDGVFRSERVHVYLAGCGPDEGNTVDVSIHAASLPTAVGDDPANLPASVPSLASLENYPNPFNPRTTVSFELRRDTTVSLRIYDLAGRLVRTLESGREVAAGRHTVEWGGTDDAGRSVASGVYVVRLDDGRESQTRRMTLVK